MKYTGLKIIDIYIIKKFLGTFFFALLLIISIAVIFDFSEKIDEFLENGAPFISILRDYYLNFIPYFATLFSPLFTFISVIFFTSKMAYNTEIIAILSSGVSFHRLLLPYFISAFILTGFSFSLNNFIIPKANEERFRFEETYVHFSPHNFTEQNVHRQIEPGIFIYLENYNTTNNLGRRFSIEKFENGRLKSKLLSEYIQWNKEKNKWRIKDYYIRDYLENTQKITAGRETDTTLNLSPEDFSRRENAVEAMTFKQLNKFIQNQRLQGSPNIAEYLVEKHRRVSFPFSTFILTIIGISVSSKKVRGGIGLQIGIGITISFTYIIFMQFSSQFAIGGAIPPLIAVWIPNIIFGIVAAFLYAFTPK